MHSRLLLILFFCANFHLNRITQNKKDPIKEQYFIEQSDSLLNIELYEDALLALFESRKYLGNKSQSAIEDEIYLKRYELLDSMISQTMKPSDFYNVRMLKSQYAFNRGNINRAFHWLDEAQLIFPEETDIEDRRNDFITSLPTDTIPAFWNKPYSLIRIQKIKGSLDELYWHCAKDSSLFNGIWIVKSAPAQLNKKYRLTFNNYKNGIFVHSRSEAYCHNYRSESSSLQLCEKVEMVNDTLITEVFRTYSDIKTLTKSYEKGGYNYWSEYTTGPDKEDFYHTESFIHSIDYDSEKSVTYRYNENGDTIERNTATYYDQNGANYHLAITNSDTTFFEQLDDTGINGLRIFSVYDEKYNEEKQDYHEFFVTIREVYSNGKLIDIKNTNALLVDNSTRLISEEAFIELWNSLEDDQFYVEFLENPTDQYQIVIYANLESLKKSKLDRLLNKQIKMDKKRKAND